VLPPELALFSYHQTTKANAVKFMHQSLCNPPITSLIKAINAGFLHGAPHLNAKSIQKYLMPSPVTSKGHMKQPCKGLQSTTPKLTCPFLPRPPCAPSIHQPVMPGLNPDNNHEDNSNHPRPAFIDDINNESIANVFCFGTFADKNTSVVYNNCTGNFPFMLLDGNICFFVMYHYKTNAIFAMPIPGLDLQSILDAYKKNFGFLVSKGYTPKINDMDNQATKAITLPHTSVASSLSNPAITASTPLNGLSKHLKIDSLTPLAPPRWTFPSNFGTSLHLRCKTP
jgi:hypothetical protein